MKKTENSSSIHGVGRRKTAVARVWLKKGSGKIKVNGKDYQEYFDTRMNCEKVAFPFKALGLEKDYDTQINICGGGLLGQAEASRLGISRALLSQDEKFKSALRKHGLLTVDSRVKERKKYGQKAARRKFQFVKR